MMNQVYFIPLCLARRSLRQAFGLIPKAVLGGWSVQGKFRLLDSLGSRMILLSTLLLPPVGCVGTRVGPGAGEPVRTGLFAHMVDGDVDHGTSCPEKECLGYSEQQEGVPRESLMLPGLKGNSAAKPPEASRFLPVPTRPVFEPIATY